MGKFLSSEGIRDLIIDQGKSNTENVAFFIDNISKALEEFTKGGVTIDSGRKMGTAAYKGMRDLARGDVPCATLCCISGSFELASGVLVWVPIPGNYSKIQLISTFKGISAGCQRFRDLCSADPSNPFC